MQDLYAENWWKKSKSQVNEESYINGLEDNITKMSILPQLIYRLNVIPIKIAASIF